MDMSTDPSRDEIVEVTEFMQVKPHPRPLKRARACYAGRTGNTPWERRHIESGLRNDHHPSDLPQGSQVEPGRAESGGLPRCAGGPSELHRTWSNWSIGRQKKATEITTQIWGFS